MGDVRVVCDVCCVVLCCVVLCCIVLSPVVLCCVEVYGVVFFSLCSRRRCAIQNEDQPFRVVGKNIEVLKIVCSQ